VDKHSHLVLQLDDGRDLRYHDVRKFGRIRLFPKEELAAELDRLKLGPEPWELDADAFYQQLQRRKQAIKLVLLDQHV
ncbi:DNA-formamidopyrimidine glycosylase, partial [Aerococcus urinae]|nr:DNA-formamidopyrimidine glycosylase [Aerococcus urinae]